MKGDVLPVRFIMIMVHPVMKHIPIQTIVTNRFPGTGEALIPMETATRESRITVVPAAIAVHVRFTVGIRIMQEEWNTRLPDRG